MDTLSTLESRVSGENDSLYSEPWKIEVLLVDDSDMDRAWVARQLAAGDEFAATFTEARSVEEALRLLSTRSFDVALVDYRLPDGLGDHIVATLSAQQPACATVLLSSHSMSEVSLFGLRAGASAALSKDDINPVLLETTVRFALFNQRQRRRGAD